VAADSAPAGRIAALGGPAATVFSVVAFGAIVTASLGAEPVIAEQLMLELHLPAHTAGMLLGTEFLAAMLALCTVVPPGFTASGDAVCSAIVSHRKPLRWLLPDRRDAVCLAGRVGTGGRGAADCRTRLVRIRPDFFK
jgi:hypothetical protein